MKMPQEYYERFLQGDTGALEDIIRAYRDGLVFYLHGIVGDLRLAEELTEDVFVKLVVKRPRFSGRSTFKTWLYTVGRNVARDHMRRCKHRDVALDDCMELSDEEKDLERSYIGREEQILIHRAMGKLKPEYRQILWLRYFEDFSLSQVARIMGKTTHNAETLAYRARKALKEILTQEGYVYEKL